MSDTRAFGQVVTEHVRQLQTTYGTTYLVADSALYSEENLQKQADAGITWITRVPATLTEAQHALEQATPEAMVPLKEGYRYHVRASTYGGVAQRWVLIHSEHRRPQAQRTIDKHWRQQSEADAKAFQKLCRTAFACEADAQQALVAFTQGLRTTTLPDSLIRASPSRVVSSWRPTPWTIARYHLWNCWKAIRASNMWNAASSFSKTHAFWPPRSI